MTQSTRSFIFLFAVAAFCGCGQPTESTTATPSPDRAAPVSSSEEGTEIPPDHQVEESAPVEPFYQQVSASAFLDAALEGKFDTVQQAIEGGMSVTTTDAEQRTALHLAAFNGHTQIVAYLLGQQAPVDERDVSGRTALMYAATGPNAETVARLLEAGADPNATDSGEKFTALMHAAAEGHAPVVQVLLSHNADATLKDVDGDTAGDFAAQNGHQDVLNLLGP